MSMVKYAGLKFSNKYKLMLARGCGNYVEIGNSVEYTYVDGVMR